jgi:hypothetical protein
MRKATRRGVEMRCFGACGIVTISLALVGCGGTHRNEVSGDVTFAGKAIPAGRIYFTPDTSKGNDGPQGWAEIKNGRFDTRDGGQGAVGGPMNVVIAGNDGAKGDGQGLPLFDDFSIKIDLPAESSTQKFDVPANAPKTRKVPTRKM